MSTDLTTALTKLLSPWGLAGLLTDWDGYQGYRRWYTYGGGGGTPWLHVSGDGPAGVIWWGTDRIRHRATWPQVRAVLAGIPAPQVAELSEAVHAARASVGVAVDPVLLRRERSALAACWAALRTADEPLEQLGQLDLFDVLAGSR